MFFGKLFGSSFRFRCRDLGLPGLPAASVFTVPAHHLPPVFESERELSMSRVQYKGVCVLRRRIQYKKCVWWGSNLLPFAFFATSTLSLAASRHASFRAFAFPNAKADTMTHSTTTTTTEELLFSREKQNPNFGHFSFERHYFITKQNLKIQNNERLSQNIFDDSVQRTSLTKRRARGKTGKKLGLQLRTLVVMEDDRDDDVAEQVENEGLLAGRGGAR